MTDDELRIKLRGIADYISLTVWMRSSTDKLFHKRLRHEPVFAEDAGIDFLCELWGKYNGESLQTPEEMLAFFSRMRPKEVALATRLEASGLTAEVIWGDQKRASH